MLEPKDIRVDHFGGGRPFADSNEGMTWPTVRVTHIPTGIYGESSGAKSNVKNKEIASQILLRKLFPQTDESSD